MVVHVPRFEMWSPNKYTYIFWSWRPGTWMKKMKLKETYCNGLFLLFAFACGCGASTEFPMGLKRS